MVNAGVLQVNNTTGSATGTGNVTVNSGATLSGLAAPGFTNGGTISGNVTVNGNGMLLATSANTLTFGSLSLNAMAVSNFQVGGPTASNAIVISNPWANDASGVWSGVLNWTNFIPPNAVGAQANFLGLINQARTTTVDGAYTVGTMTFNNLNTYTVANDGVAGHGLTFNRRGRRRL